MLAWAMLMSKDATSAVEGHVSQVIAERQSLWTRMTLLMAIVTLAFLA